MDSLMLYNVSDYQALLESLQTFFDTFLLTEHVSAVSRKNYRSDLRDFVGWIISTIKTTVLPHEETPRIFLSKISTEDIEEYKRSLHVRNIPVATINRRLSTIRKFFTAAVSYGMLDTNPALVIRNLPSEESLDIAGTLVKFRQALLEEGASDITIKSYAADVREFLEWAT